jgi:hypothetical protein
MTDTEFLARFERRTGGTCFYVRERVTGKRTRLYIGLAGCRAAVERGELYTDAEYTALTTIAAGAAPRQAYSKHQKRGSQ